MPDEIKELFNKYARVSWDVPLTDKTVPIILNSIGKNDKDYLLSRMKNMTTLAGKSFMGLDFDEAPKPSYAGRLEPIFEILEDFIIPTFSGVSTSICNETVYRCILMVSQNIDSDVIFEVGFFVSRHDSKYGGFTPILPGDNAEKYSLSDLKHVFDSESFKERDVEAFKELFIEAIAATFLSVQALTALSKVKGIKE